MKKYFGLLTENKVDDLSEEKQLDFLIDNKLFYVSNSYAMDVETLEIIPTPESQLSLNPTGEVINAFYGYLKQRLSRDIDQPFLHFFNDFNERIYGLEEIPQRKIALLHFNEYYKKIKVLEASFVRREKDANGIEQIKNMNRFDFLKGRQQGQKQQIASLENILEFLNGNEDYFKGEHFKSDKNSKQFIVFECTLKILISLNGQYKFEEDLHNTASGKLKSLYNKYSNIFESFEIFTVIDNKIKNFKSSKVIQITSFYEALIAMKLVEESKANFLNYVNQEHQLELTKLTSYEFGENKQHDIRVQQFKIELQEYSTEEKELAQNTEKSKTVKTNKKRLETFTDKDALDYLLKNTFNCK